MRVESADAKHALEAKLAKHAAAESICVSRYDTARICEMNQKEIANLEVQHEQEAEHLRLQWVMELKVWGDYVALLRERLHHKIPDARWISHLLRKAHRAQRCYETALELEAFLEKYCADPDPVLTLDMWEKPDIWDNPSDNATPLSPQTAALPPPPVAGQPPAAAMLPERDGRSQDSRKDRDTETGQREEDAKRKEKERKKEEERQKKEEEKRRKDKEAADLVDDSCPLYRCKGCDKVFAVRGMLSVSDMQGLNVGTRRYVDSKTARAARDAHRKDAHPHLSCDAPAAVSAQSTTASSASASLSSPRRALETAGNANREREGEVSKSTRAENPPKVPDLGIRFHGAALQQTSAAPKDPRLAKGANAAAASTDLRDTKQASSRHVHTQDFVPASAKGIREDIEGYVYKYGKSGPGYYRIVGSDVRGSAEQSEKSPRSHAAGEYASGGSCSSMNGGAASSSGGKKTIAEMIQDRTRQKEEAEKERVRKEMENQLRLEAEVKLREELRQMKEQLEKDRISQQKQKEAEERERARRQQLEDERLRAELRGLKEQLDRQEREREREWDRRQQNSNSQHDKTGRSPPRPTRMTMEHRMSARLPSPPSPPRERVRRTRDDSDVEDGEIREVSPPRPTLNRHQVDFHRVSSPAASPQVAASHARVDKEVVKAQQTSEALLRSLSAGDGGSENDEMEDVGIAHGGEAADKCKDNSAAKRKGVQDSGKCNSKHHSGGADAERACSPLLPSLRSADEQDEDEDEDVATAHSDDEEKPKAKKGKAKVAKPIAASPATGGGAKRKAAAEQGAQGNSKTAKMSKSAMLKEFSRTEVRAGEALLALYDYYFTAAQQMETARALNGVPPSAAQIGDNLVQKELHDAVAARIQVGARIKVFLLSVCMSLCVCGAEDM